MHLVKNPWQKKNKKYFHPMHPVKEWNSTLKCAIGPECEEALQTGDRNSIWKPLTTARCYSKSFRQPILSLSIYKIGWINAYLSRNTIKIRRRSYAPVNLRNKNFIYRRKRQTLCPDLTVHQ